MKRLGAMTTTLVFLSIACGAVAAGDVASTNAEPLAVVGDRAITRARFEREMERRGGGLPGQYVTLDDRRALLEELVRSEALIARAIEAGYDRDPEVLAALERIIVSRFRKDRLEPLLAEVEVPDDEVERFYDENREAYARPARLQVALVRFAVPAQASEEQVAETERKARAALEEASQLGESVRHFGSVARKYSDDRASRYKGGIIGWLYPDSQQNYRWDASVMDAAFALERPGQFAPVIRAADGFYLVRLVRREEALARPLALLQDGLRHQLTMQKQERIRETFVEELLTGIAIEINEPLFGTIGPPESSGERPAPEPPPLPTR